MCGRLFLCKFPVLPDRDDRPVCRPKVLIQNTKRGSRGGNAMTINPDWLAEVTPKRGHGSAKLVASFGAKRPQGFWSREDQADGLMPWTTDTKTGSSETAGRNRYPRLLLAKESFLPC